MGKSGDTATRLTLTVEEAAHALGISWASGRGGLGGEDTIIRIAKRILVSKAGLERMLSED